MKICIVDDEKSCVDNLYSLLYYYGRENNIDLSFEVFNNGESFLRAYEPNTYSIIFLDIYIGKTTGMELAEHIRKKSETGMIIFCTTSINDMPQAFRYHAFEYIIKPPDYDRIKKIMDDAISVLPELEKFIDIQTTNGKAHIALSNLISVTSNGHYLELHLKDNVFYTTRMTMTDFKNITENDTRFLSINKGILVNMDHIKNIEDKNCIMVDDSIFPIKVRESSNIKKLWQNYIFESIRKGQKNGL